MEFKRFIVIIMAVLLMAIIGTALTPPYRYESGMKLYLSDFDLSGKNLSNGSVTSWTNVSNSSAVPGIGAQGQNRTVTFDEDLVLVDASKGSVNLSLPGAANVSGKIYQFKKVDASAGNMTVQSAMFFMPANESNRSNQAQAFQNTISTWKYNNTYFYSFNVSSKGFNLSTISIKVAAAEGWFNASVYNDTGANRPFQRMARAPNTSLTTIAANGWHTAVFDNQTVRLESGQRYWLAVVINNSQPYLGNATYFMTTVFNLTNNNSGGNMPTFANQTALNKTGNMALLVPMFAFNLSQIEDTTTTTGTSTQYGTIKIQSDGNRWWKV